MRNEQMTYSQARPAVTPTTLEVPSLVDALYIELRERILTGALPGGTAVTEMELATQYSVARPTAKAAMERLVHEGLLRRGSHKTAKVPVLGVNDILDLYRTRGYVEREAIAALAEKRLVPDAARRSVQQLSAVEPDAPLAEVVNFDVGFHTALVDALGSPRLTRLYRSLMAEVRLCMAQVQVNRLMPPATIAGEHSALMAEIERGDVAGAVREITNHLERACKSLTGYLESAAAPER